MIAKPKIVQEITPRATEQPEAPGALLTPAELAARLAVGKSWVREKCRIRGRLRDKDPLPCKRLGKYVRFSWPEIQAWLERQNG